jgi:hypothetical protein
LLTFLSYSAVFVHLFYNDHSFYSKIRGCYYNMSYTYSRTKLIDKIKFGLLSPDEIRKMSAARIITADTYDEDGLPIPSGLMDQRLGTIEPGQRCQTCGNLVSNCMGHFGHCF